MNEIKRHYVLQLVEDKRLTGVEASKHLGLSVRHMRRLLAKYLEEVVQDLVQGNYSVFALASSKTNFFFIRKMWQNHTLILTDMQDFDNGKV